MEIVEQISMKCTREQYESIMHLVGRLTGVSDKDFIDWHYLTNDKDGTVWMYKEVSNSYKTFNKDIFLKACGIDFNQTQTVDEIDEILAEKRKEFNKKIAMFKKAQSVVRGLGAEHCNITYIGTDSGYAINAEGGTELDGSFTITITGNKTK